MKTYTVKKITPTSLSSWKDADSITDFSYPWQENTPPQTSFRAWHDEEYFYFRFEAEDPYGYVYVDKNDKMEVVNSERVEIFFQVDKDLKTYYCLEMDPLARVLDYKAAYYRRMTFDWSWPANALQIDAKKNNKGYALSGRITLQSLRDLDILKGSTMKAGLYRGECIALNNGTADLQWISWVDPKTPEPDFHVASSFGVMKLE